MIRFGSADKWGWFSYLDDDGCLVIGDNWPHEGGELYHGEYMGDDTPYILSLKKDDVKQYNKIVKYFKENKIIVRNRKRVLIFPSVHATTNVVNYDATNNCLNTFLSAFDVWNSKGNFKLSDDNNHQEVWFEMDFDFYMISKCDTLRKAIEHFGVEVVHDCKIG
jgi:hypothetical protein